MAATCYANICDHFALTSCMCDVCLLVCRWSVHLLRDCKTAWHHNAGFKKLLRLTRRHWSKVHRSAQTHTEATPKRQTQLPKHAQTRFDVACETERQRWIKYKCIQLSSTTAMQEKGGPSVLTTTRDRRRQNRWIRAKGGTVG